MDDEVKDLLVRRVLFRDRVLNECFDIFKLSAFDQSLFVCRIGIFFRPVTFLERLVVDSV
jgi:hypothetical protein